MNTMILEKSCMDCDNGRFFVNTSRKNWGHKKYCDDCRKNRHRLVEQRRRESLPPLTDEQRRANEMLRRQRSADGRRGQTVSQERRDKTSATLKRRYAAGEIAVVTYEKTPEIKAKISEGLVKAYQEGRADITAYYKNKWWVYDGPNGRINMRSKSETIFAHHLDSIGLRWEYEPRRFDLGWATYTPDFYLVDSDHWIEVKGGWNRISRRKFDEFQQIHSASFVMARDVLKGAGLMTCLPT